MKNHEGVIFIFGSLVTHVNDNHTKIICMVDIMNEGSNLGGTR